VLTDAYLSASEGQHSPELDRLNAIDRFGVEAIMHRPILYFGEIRKMIYAENVALAYRSRKASENHGKWAHDHPQLEKIIINAEMLMKDE